MITFKQYLQEESEDKVHKNVKQAAEAYMKHCSQWKNVSAPLWRWSNAPEGQIGHPMRTREVRTRKKSRGGTGDIQGYLESLTSWEEVPHRMQSIFCATTQLFLVSGGSDDDENKLAIFPFNGATIAQLTQDNDFNYMNITRGIPDFDEMEPDGLQEWIYSTAGKFYDSYNSVNEMIPALQRTFTKNGKFDLDIGGPTVKAIYEEMTEKRQQDLRNFVEAVPQCFTPAVLGIKVTTQNSFSMPNTLREVWFSDKYLSIPLPQFEEFVKEVKLLQGSK